MPKYIGYRPTSTASSVTKLQFNPELVVGLGGLGSASVFESAQSDFFSVTSIGNDKVVIAYRDRGNSNYGTAIVGTISGTSITFGGPVVFESANSGYISVTYIGNDKVVIAYKDAGNSNYGTAIVGTISGTSITFGGPVVFESAESDFISVTSIGNDKVVIAYKDKGNSNYGTAIVGTIAGTSITFGGPVVFESANSEYISVTSIGNDKVVIAYNDNGNSAYGTAIVGTIAGTSITFGTPVVFESASSWYFSVTSIGNDKVVIAYSDRGNSDYGTAIVGTISGTSITFGTPVVFESATSDYISVTSIGNDKVVIAYSDRGNPGYGTAIFGTISGTSITFDTPVVFESYSSEHSVTSIGNDKVVIAYKDFLPSEYGTAIVISITIGGYEDVVDTKYNSGILSIRDIYSKRSKGSWPTTTRNTLDLEYLIIGGGGSGGANLGGGGGGGEFVEGSILGASGSYDIVVGAGGAAVTGNENTNGNDGGTSTFNGISAIGGGGGGGQPFNGRNGGSGGGGAGNATTTGGTGTAPTGLGNNGGTGVGGDNNRGAGGGGGAGAVGANGSATTGGGDGGSGASWSINAIFYAGGGGGGAKNGTGAGAGGNGGGGAASDDSVTPTNGFPGTDGLGGGGGGGPNVVSSVSGKGGDGVVIIAYLGSTIKASGGTITYNNGYTLHTFTSSGTFSSN